MHVTLTHRRYLAAKCNSQHTPKSYISKCLIPVYQPENCELQKLSAEEENESGLLNVLFRKLKYRNQVQ
jgi:hypothetical protein